MVVQSKVFLLRPDPQFPAQPLLRTIRLNFGMDISKQTKTYNVVDMNALEFTDLAICCVFTFRIV